MRVTKPYILWWVLSIGLLSSYLIMYLISVSTNFKVYFNLNAIGEYYFEAALILVVTISQCYYLLRTLKGVRHERNNKEPLGK